MKKRKKKLKKLKHYKFINKDGHEIELRGDLTIEDLLRMGYDNIGLVDPEIPIKPHEWRHTPTTNQK